LPGGSQDEEGDKGRRRRLESNQMLYSTPLQLVHLYACTCVGGVCAILSERHLPCGPPSFVSLLTDEAPMVERNDRMFAYRCTPAQSNAVESATKAKVWPVPNFDSKVCCRPEFSTGNNSQWVTATECPGRQGRCVFDPWQHAYVQRISGYFDVVGSSPISGMSARTRISVMTAIEIIVAC
jgi:hypothetical protein